MPGKTPSSQDVQVCEKRRDQWERRVSADDREQASPTAIAIDSVVQE